MLEGIKCSNIPFPFRGVYKMSFYKQYRNQSVINSDNFDRRRFNKVYNMSRSLQDLNNFEKPFPTFEPLLGDIWGALYKMSPQLHDGKHIKDELKTNHSFMEKILTDEDIERYREYTKLDELSSAIGTVRFGEKTKEWLEEQRQDNNKLDQSLRDIEHMQQQQKKQEQQDGAGQVNEQLQKALQQAMENLHNHISKELQNDRQHFSNMISQAMKETQQTKDGVKSLLGGTKAGSGEAELQKVPLREQIRLAEKISCNKHLQTIAEWAGRFKQIARQKQKSIYQNSIERSGVGLGNDIEKLLPSELSLYKNESTKLEFLRRFVEGQTMQYDTKGKESLGKGPIILCLDQSGSMHKLDYQSKGFALALMSIAKRQKRDFCYIPFSTKTQVYRFVKGNISSSEMIQLSENFLGGGTNFELPLYKSIEIINESRFKQSDIVFVTDGEDGLNESFLNEFNQVKKEKEFSVLSLVMGERIATPRRFSDRVIQIDDLNDEGGYTAFEI